MQPGGTITLFKHKISHEINQLLQIIQFKHPFFRRFWKTILLTFCFSSSLFSRSPGWFSQWCTLRSMRGGQITASLTMASSEWRQTVALTLWKVFQDGRELSRWVRVHGRGLHPTLLRWWPSSSPLISCNFCKRSDTWWRWRARGCTLTEPNRAAEDALQGSKARRWRLVQVPIVATRTRSTAPRSTNWIAGCRRWGDVDIHLPLNYTLTGRVNLTWIFFFILAKEKEKIIKDIGV